MTKKQQIGFCSMGEEASVLILASADIAGWLCRPYILPFNARPEGTQPVHRAGAPSPAWHSLKQLFAVVSPTIAFSSQVKELWKGYHLGLKVFGF